MIGQVIQNYKIESILGEGGMGIVYLASHTLLNRKAAIKALSPLLAANNDLKMRFYKEASTMSNLKHPNIVTLYDYIEDMGNLYLVMEYIDGVPLDKYVKNYGKPLPEDKIIHFFSQILDAFEYAHSKKVIHRDIKPANIIISNDDTVKILDFGIAKLLDETSEKLTQTGSKVGTVTFMSPEQVKALPVDNRSDIYSLGVAMYQIATGKCPYEDLGSE